VLHIEYESSARDRDSLLQETYQLAMKLHAFCARAGLSLYARRGASGGLRVATRTDPFPSSRADFERQAAITHLRDP
jgi:hypothetical protein